MFRLQRTVFYLSLALGLALMVAGLSGRPVNAQEAPELSVSPEEITLPMGMGFEITLEVTGGENLNAYDVTIRYDPGIITLEEWRQGTYMSNLGIVYLEEEPGLLRLAATQLATPPVSGDGTLVVLSFLTTGIGTTDIEIEDAVFNDGEDNEVKPDRKDGRVTTTTDPTHTPTHTPTNTPTLTLTLELTFTELPPTPTSSPTEEPSPTFTEVLNTVQPSPTILAEGSRTQPAQQTQEIPTDEVSLQAATANVVTGEETSGGQDFGSGDTGEAGSQGTTAQVNRTRLLNWLLWGMLIVSVIAVLVMLWILRGRRKNQEEDLLL